MDTTIGCLPTGPRHTDHDVATPEPSDPKQDSCNGRTLWLNYTREAASELLLFRLPRDLRDQIYDYALDGASIRYRYGIVLVTPSYGRSSLTHNAFFPHWMHTNQTLLLETSEQFHRPARFIVDFDCDPFAQDPTMKPQYRTKLSRCCLPNLEFARCIAIESVIVEVCYTVVDDSVFKTDRYQRLTLQTVFRHTTSVKQLRIRLATHVTLEQNLNWRSEYTRFLTLLDAVPRSLSMLRIELDFSILNCRVADYDRQNFQRYLKLAQAVGRWSGKVMCDSVQSTDSQERRWLKEKKEGLDHGYFMRKRTLILEKSTAESNGGGMY